MATISGKPRVKKLAGECGGLFHFVVRFSNRNTNVFARDERRAVIEAVAVWNEIGRRRLNPDKRPSRAVRYSVNPDGTVTDRGGRHPEDGY